MTHTISECFARVGKASSLRYWLMTEPQIEQRGVGTNAQKQLS